MNTQITLDKTLNKTTYLVFNKKSLLNNLFQEFSNTNMISKLVTYFGNLKSKVLILGIAPALDHYRSNSKSVFCFDINNFEHTNKSGSVILKIFKDLKLNKDNYLFENIFKAPWENMDCITQTKHLDLLKKEIQIINPLRIICLGNVVYSNIISLGLSNAITISKLLHPAFILRKNWSNYESYLEQWRVLLT